MQNIYIEGNLLIYYGNTVGYIESGKAVVDSMFESAELSEWLTEHRNLRCHFNEGVFKRLADGLIPREARAEQIPNSALQCRVWQLRPESDLMIRFRDYDELPSPPKQENYQITFEGDIEADGLDEIENMLEETGHPLRISDVIEVITNGESRFYYIGKTKFVPVNFTPPGRPQEKENITEAK